jgi:hypothetical protein
MEAGGYEDINQAIAISWDKLLKSTQKEARDFLA